MKKRLLFFLFLCSFSLFSQKQKTFYQKDKTLVTIRIANDSIMEITTSKNNSKQIINGYGDPEIEKEPTMVVDDYNFDGYQDLAVHQADAGMGVYEVYSLYIYNPKTNQFNLLEIPENPKANCSYLCDLKIDRKNKRLISSCRGGAKWHKDYWVFNKKGRLVLLYKTINN